MPRRVSIDAEALLVTYKEAARMLGCTETRVLTLIQAGHLTPHPYEDGKIARAQVIAYATNYWSATQNEPRESDLRPKQKQMEEATSFGFHIAR